MVQGGRPTGPGAMLNTPLVLNSTFRAGGELGYGRSGNDTWAAFEDVMGELEGGEAIAFSSGIAAASAVLDLVPIGGTIVAPTSFYMGLWSQLGERAESGRANIHFVDQTDTAAVLNAAQGADLVWVQDEPENQGAWPFIALEMRRLGLDNVRVVSRPASASPATGSLKRSSEEHIAVMDGAFEGL